MCHPPNHPHHHRLWPRLYLPGIINIHIRVGIGIRLCGFIIRLVCVRPTHAVVVVCTCLMDHRYQQDHRRLVATSGQQNSLNQLVH